MLGLKKKNHSKVQYCTTNVNDITTLCTRIVFYVWKSLTIIIFVYVYHERTPNAKYVGNFNWNNMNGLKFKKIQLSPVRRSALLLTVGWSNDLFWLYNNYRTDKLASKWPTQKGKSVHFFFKRFCFKKSPKVHRLSIQMCCGIMYYSIRAIDTVLYVLLMAL